MCGFLNGTLETPKTSKITQKDERINNNNGNNVASVVAKQGKVDLDKLYWAVAKHESGKCATSWHKKANNCVSIMTWVGGKRHLKQFPSIIANKEAWKALWIKSYGGGLPTLALAKRYSGDDKAVAWYKNVTKFYND